MIAAVVVATPDVHRANVEALLKRLPAGVGAAARVEGGGSGVVAVTGAVASRESGQFANITLTATGMRLERGRMAGRPIYWAREGDLMFACTRLAPVVDALGTRRLDEESLARTVGTVDDASERTPYIGIERVRCGEIVELDGAGVRRSEAPAPHLDPLDAAPEELARALRAELRDAVARSIRGRRKVAVLTGGGVDSSAVLALALEVARTEGGPEVEAIALDFACEGDDRPHLRELARALGIEPVRITPRECGGNVRRGMILDAAPAPFPPTPWELAMMDLARARGADAFLTGAGGDALFDGDPTEYAAEAMQGRVASALLGALRLRVPWASSPSARVWQYVLRPIARRFVPASARRPWRRRGRIRGLPAWAGRRTRAVILSEPDAASLHPPRTPDERFASLWRSPGVLFLADACAQGEATSGIDHEKPLLDERLVMFASRLPPLAHLHGGRMRGLFRLALRGLVPDSVRLRPDKAVFEPATEELLASIGGLRALEDLAEMRALGSLELVEPGPFRQAFEAYARGEGIHWIPMWAALSAEAFARTHLGL